MQINRKFNDRVRNEILGAFAIFNRSIFQFTVYRCNNKPRRRDETYFSDRKRHGADLFAVPFPIHSVHVKVCIVPARPVCPT